MILGQMQDAMGMKSLDATHRKFSSRGVDGRSGLLGIGLELTDVGPDGGLSDG